MENRNKKKRLGIFQNIAPSTPTRHNSNNNNSNRPIRPPPGFESIQQQIDNVKQTDDKNESHTVPEAFLCQLSKQLMTNPVCISNGEMFESEVIKKYFKTTKEAQSPITGEKLKNKEIIPTDQD